MLQDLYVKINVYHSIIGSKVIQINTKDNFNDLRSTICQSTFMMFFQNFSLQIQNKTFNQYAEIGQLLTNGSRINIVFQPFDQKTSKYHFHKVKSLLEHPNILSKNMMQQFSDKKNENVQKQTDMSDIIDKMQNQSYLQLTRISQPQLNLGQLINYSGFNFPPSYRKLAGDFYYIIFKSPEQIDYHITANAQGFFVNQSSSSHFNPNLSFKFQTVNISLLDLLSKISPKFKQIYQQNFNFSQGDTKGSSIINKRNQWLKKAEIPKYNFAWKVNSLERKLKRQDFLNIKDWNQILQIQALESYQSSIDKITKDKLKYKIYHEFIQQSKVGAVNIIQKNLLPLNPDCPKLKQVFLYSSILFTFADFVNEQKSEQTKSESYLKIKELLKNSKSKQANNYINNLELLDRLNIPGLHLSHMAIIKYKGFKIKAQSLPSSILYGRNQYTSFEEVIKDKAISINSKQIEPILKSITRILNIQTQNFILTQKEEKQRKSYVQKAGIHPQIKWIQNKDKRKYILNLHNFSPKDTNFLNHKQNLFRPELIAIYNQKQKCRIPINILIGKQDHFSLILNDKIKQQQNKLKSIGYFAKEICVQSVITLLEDDLKKYLADSKNIIQIMHKYGLNCRYLGLIYQKIDSKKSPQLKITIQRVVLVKSLKNLFNSALKSVLATNLRQVIAHLLNIVFFPKKLTQDYMNNLCNKHQAKQQEVQYANEPSKKKKKKWNKEKQRQDTNLAILFDEESINFLNLTSSEVQVVVKHIAKTKYNFKFQQTLSSLKCLNVKYGKSAVLRDLCLNIGLVLEQRNYFQIKTQSLFQPEFILEFKVKQTYIHPQKKQIDVMIQEADRKSALFQVQQSIDAYNKAIQYVMASYGATNEKLALIHKKMSNIYFRIGDIQTALLFAHHSCSMLQQLLGKDQVQTIQNNILLGFYNCAKRNFKQSQAYLLKSIYYASIAYSETYPQLLTLYMNLSTVYEIQKKYPQAIISLVQGLNIVKNIYGEDHVHLGIFYAALASLHLQIPDVQKSIFFQTKAVKNLKKNLTQNDPRLKQSSEMLEYYQSLQNTKKIKQIHQKQQRKCNSKLFKNVNKVTQYNFFKQNEEFWRRNRRGKYFI